jgi:membrane dipeptidase
MSEVPSELWTLDGHCDSIERRFARGISLDLCVAEEGCHVTTERLRAGNLRGLFTMVGDRNLTSSLRMIGGLCQVVADHPEDLALCLSSDDVRTAVSAGQAVIVLTIEGQSMFEEHVELLRDWHRLGVRVCSLTHNEGTDDTPYALQVSRSHFGYLSPAEREALRKEQKGLTDFARTSLAEMGRLGLACDLAHANEVTFWETLECATGPVCYTHGNCAALCPHTRNMTDEMMSALAGKGGVLGCCFYGPFVSKDDPTLERYVGHVLHALELMGEGGVGIGTDFDGVPEGAVMVVPEPSRMNDLWEALDKHGVSREVMVKIAHENFLRMIPA